MSQLNKNYRDINKYLFSTNEFSYLERSDDSLYPIDLDFTLADEGFYYAPKDEQGIPVKEYVSVGSQYNPTRIAAYGLAHFNRYAASGLKESKRVFFKCADWFLSNTQARYEYHFDWVDLKAPWISCMAQGEAASVLVRAYRLSGKQFYLNHAEESLDPFFKVIEEGGVQSRLSDGSIFVEEYPSAKPTHVLNGFLYALIGLGEYADATGSQSHQELFDNLVRSLCKNIDIWCYARWSLYEERGKANGLNFCTPSYHNLQITQLKWLNKRVNNPDIQHVIETWEKGLNSFFMRFYALFGKVYFRLKNKAQR